MPKSRAITRPNENKGKEEERLTLLGPGGHLDSTPYFALKNIEKARKDAGRKTA